MSLAALLNSGMPLAITGDALGALHWAIRNINPEVLAALPLSLEDRIAIESVRCGGSRPLIVRPTLTAGKGDPS